MPSELQDAHGVALKVGDRIIIPGVVMELYPNVGVVWVKFDGAEKPYTLDPGVCVQDNGVELRYAATTEPTHAE